MATPPRSAAPRGARTKRPTATDVARRAGVSQATVSYVMNNTPHQVIPEPTRQRVLAAAAELGYTPSAAARMLVSGRSDVVLLLLPDWPIGLGVASLLDELSQAFAQHDLTFVIHPQVTARPVTELWKSITPAAVLAYESFSETDLTAISRSGAELVLISDLDHGAGAMDRSVERTGRIQVEHLARAGHRHLGYAWPDNDRVLFFAQHRLDGVRAACAELGLPRTASDDGPAHRRRRRRRHRGLAGRRPRRHRHLRLQRRGRARRSSPVPGSSGSRSRMTLP